MIDDGLDRFHDDHDLAQLDIALVRWKDQMRITDQKDLLLTLHFQKVEGHDVVSADVDRLVHAVLLLLSLYVQEKRVRPEVLQPVFKEF